MTMRQRLSGIHLWAKGLSTEDEHSIYVHLGIRHPLATIRYDIDLRALKS